MDLKEGKTKIKCQDKWKTITTGIVALLMIALAVLLIVMKYSNAHTDRVSHENSIKAELGQLEDKTKEEIQAALNEIVEEGNLSISMNMNPVFPTGDSQGSLKIENGPQNRYGQRVVITLDETGQQIYDSGYMPVNTHIQQDVLEIDLGKGEYEATATFSAYDEDLGGAMVGQVAAKIKISVLS